MATVTGGAFAPTVKRRAAAPVAPWVKDVRKVLAMFPYLDHLMVSVEDGEVYVSDSYACVRLRGAQADAMRSLLEAQGSPLGGSFEGRRSGEPVKVWFGSHAPKMAQFFERDGYTQAACVRRVVENASDRLPYADGAIECSAPGVSSVLDATRATRLGAAGARVVESFAPVKLTDESGDVFAVLMPLRGITLGKEVTL